MQAGPGAPPPGARPPQAQAPQGAPAPGGGAAQLVSQIGDGIQKLKPMLGAVHDAQLKQAFMGLDSAFQAFVEAASQPAGQPGQSAPPPQAPARPAGPMPANAAPGSKPSNYSA